MSRAAIEVGADPQSWPVVGVYPPGPRIAVIEVDADRELAAYVLARTSLRRTGTDPRATKRAYVVGTVDRLQRHLQRLWLGANLGPAADSDSFAGPVDAATRDAFLEACTAWRDHEGVDTWVPGGPLERTGDTGIYLAPALVSCSWPPPDLPTTGPILVVVRCGPDQARAAADQVGTQAGQIVQFGGRPHTYAGHVRLIRGALLVERLPPGLPEPRPV
jgi:acyl-CoA reductase-like NAD-dependent aldehyde dehydrogenase